jgi:hypothetical protein
VCSREREIGERGERERRLKIALSTHPSDAGMIQTEQISQEFRQANAFATREEVVECRAAATRKVVQAVQESSEKKHRPSLPPSQKTRELWSKNGLTLSSHEITR